MKTKTPLHIRKMMMKFREELVTIYGDKLKAVYLYGSYARGDYRPGSDVDVMILLSDYRNYWNELKRISQLASDISLEYDVTVSCIFVKQQQWENAQKPLIYNIRKEGVPV